jgi:hypothetical protein
VLFQRKEKLSFFKWRSVSAAIFYSKALPALPVFLPRQTMARTNRITSRYAALPLISFLLKLLGYLALLAAVFSAGRTLYQGRVAADLTDVFLIAFGRLASGFGQALLFVAASEVIHVLLDIESNTRRAADAASGQLSGTTPRL